MSPIVAAVLALGPFAAALLTALIVAARDDRRHRATYSAITERQRVTDALAKHHPTRAT